MFRLAHSWAPRFIRKSPVILDTCLYRCELQKRYGVSRRTSLMKITEYFQHDLLYISGMFGTPCLTFCLLGASYHWQYYLAFQIIWLTSVKAQYMNDPSFKNYLIIFLLTYHISFVKMLLHIWHSFYRPLHKFNCSFLVYTVTQCWYLSRWLNFSRKARV